MLKNYFKKCFALLVFICSTYMLWYLLYLLVMVIKVLFPIVSDTIFLDKKICMAGLFIISALVVGTWEYVSSNEDKDTKSKIKWIK